MTEERQGVPPAQPPPTYQGLSQAWKPVLAFGAFVLVLAVLFNHSDSLAQNEDIRNEDIRNESDSFDDVAIMSGVKRTNLSKDFRGGEATAVMGGIELDLRDAVMDRREAVLDVSTVMGGMRIRVPETWKVVSRVNTVLGGYKDNTRHPANDDHRLVLKGTVLMGGLQVSN